MKLFMDESGNFTSAFGVSTVCTIALPSKSVRRVRRDITKASENWPRHGGELKSGVVDATRLKVLVDILYSHEALLHCVAINVAGESAVDAEAHKAAQCEQITKNITPEHYPAVVKALWKLRHTLEEMPLQLYFQSVAMRELVCSAIEEGAMYFSQRQPREIGSFEWVIDAKDPTKISTQEEWWRDTFGPLVESRSAHKPFALVRDPQFNYKHFHHAFRLVKDMWRPDRPREQVVGLDIKKMTTNNVSFVDSRDDILIQATDVLAGHLRKVLSGEPASEEVCRQLGRLQIIRKRENGIQPFQFLSLSKNPISPKYTNSIRTMARTGRSMILSSKG